MSHFIEALESRQLLSASVIHPLVSATIAADEAAVTTAKAQIPLDQAAANAQLKIDRAAIPATRSADQAVIHSEQTQIRLDRGNAIEEQADRGQLEIDQAKLTSDLAAAQAKIKLDSGAERVTLASDRAALKAAQTKLRDDRLAGL